jgi:hypothetical protein
VSVEPLEPSSHLRQRHGPLVRTRQRIRQAVVCDVGANPPVRAGSRRVTEGIDHLALAQCTDLVVHQVEHPIGMVCPVGLRFLFRLEFPAAIAHQDCSIVLPGRLQSQVIVDSTVSQNHSTGVRFALQIGPAAGGKGRGVQTQLTGRQHGRKGGRRGDRER